MEEEDNSNITTMSPSETPPYEAELELGLGLSIGRTKTSVTILTAKDFRPVSGTKRNADSVSHDGASSPPRLSQVVGWPPVRASRMYSLVNQAKTSRSEDQHNKAIVCDKEKQPIEALNNNNDNNNTNIFINNMNVKEQGNNLGFVKVNVDGIAIGRKIDLKAHSCYESLAQSLEDMFFRPGLTVDLNASSGETKEQGAKTSKLLNGLSEFVLTYEDKDGDWMLVGDVPWRMFLGSVKRLRIMRTMDATGLAPRFEERNERQRIKPI